MLIECPLLFSSRENQQVFGIGTYLSAICPRQYVHIHNLVTSTFHNLEIKLKKKQKKYLLWISFSRGKGLIQNQQKKSISNKYDVRGDKNVYCVIKGKLVVL